MSAESNTATTITAEVRPLGMPRGLTFLFAIAGGTAVGNLYWAQPLLQEIARAFRVATGSAGLLVTLTQVGYAVGVLLVLPLGDTIDRRRLIPSVMACSVLALAGCALAPTFAALLGASFVLGLTTVTGQLLTPLAGDLAREDQRGRVVGTVVSGVLTGILASRSISGLLADAFGWRAVFVAAALVTATIAALLAKLLPVLPARNAVPYRQLLQSVFSTVRQHRSVQVTLVLGSTSFAVFSMFWTGLTFLLSAPPFSYSVTRIGLVGLVGLAGAFAAQRAGRLHDRGWSVPATGAGLVLALASVVIAFFGAESIAMVLAAVLLVDVAIQGVLLMNQTRLFSVDPSARSRLNTAFVGCNFVGGAVGSSLAGLLWELHGWQAVMAGAAALTAFALVVWFSQRGPLSRVSNRISS
jgi:predicted MFS family arabinose efflux permease